MGEFDFGFDPDPGFESGDWWDQGFDPDPGFESGDWWSEGGGGGGSLWSMLAGLPWSQLARFGLGSGLIGLGGSGLIQAIRNVGRPSQSTQQMSLSPEQQALMAMVMGGVPGLQGSISQRQPWADLASQRSVQGLLQQAGAYPGLIAALSRQMRPGMMALNRRIPQTEQAFSQGLGALQATARQTMDPRGIARYLGQQSSLMDALLPTARILAQGGTPVLSPGASQLISQSFAPDITALNQNVATGLEGRGMGGAGMAESLAAPGLASIEGEKARALLDYGIRAPEAASRIASQYGGAAANVGNIYSQLAGALMGAGNQGLGLYETMGNQSQRLYGLINQLLSGQQGALGALGQQGQLGVMNPMALIQMLLQGIGGPRSITTTGQQGGGTLLDLMNPAAQLTREISNMFGGGSGGNQQLLLQLLRQLGLV